MKRIGFVFLAIIVIVSQLANAQSKSDKMYDVLMEKDGVSNFSFSKNMIDAIDIDLGDDDNAKNVTGDLHQIRVMSYNPEKGDISGSAFIRKAEALLPIRYKKFVDEGNNEDDNAEIYLLGGKKKFKECHVFISNSNDEQRQFVVSFYGNFTVNDLEGLKKSGRGFSSK